MNYRSLASLTSINMDFHVALLFSISVTRQIVNSFNLHQYCDYLKKLLEARSFVPKLFANKIMSKFVQFKENYLAKERCLNVKMNKKPQN